ncbi:unnamed protein product, partial [Brassica rapa subsp. trilocularis]
MSGNDAVKTAKIVVWWDMKDCPIPEGYDARQVRPSIERACKKIGYSGPVSITAYADQTQTPDHHLQALSSTGVAVAHTISECTCKLMYEDIVEWRDHNPPPATMMIISDHVEGDFSWDLARLQQRTRYKLFMAYSVQTYKDLFLLRNAAWLWKKLLEEGGGAPLVAGGLSSAMFYCKSYKFDCQSLERFRKHLSSYKHGREEFTSARWYTGLECVTKTWRRNYRATPEHATAKIQVLWDMVKCPIPEGYDARLVRPSIEAAFKKIGYSGPVSITAYADYKETPHHHLVGLSSTGVDLAHTLYWYKGSRMYDDVRQWENDNPAPASVMLISDVDWDVYIPSLISRHLQKSNYKCFLAYSFRPCKMTVMLTSAEWLWESLLSVFSEKRRRHILKNCSESASTGMFYCKLCYDCDCESLDEFTKHLSRSKTHARE